MADVGVARVRQGVCICGIGRSRGVRDPPDKEIQQAQGAIDAARAAGAAVYAKDEFAAAETALKNARDAVDQRDYRLALNYALDSRERAQSAAKEAADNKAIARSDADRALVEATAAFNAAQARLKAAEPRVSPRALAAPKRGMADANVVLQKARTDFANGDYSGIPAAVRPLKSRLSEIVHEIESVPAAPARRRR